MSSSRSKNLLEAFQATKSAEEPTVRERKLPRNPTSSSPARVSGPFAGGAPLEGGSLLESEVRVARTAAPRNALEELAREPWKFGLALGVLLLLTFSFGLWVGGDSGVGAQESNGVSDGPRGDGRLDAGLDPSGSTPSSRTGGEGAPAPGGRSSDSGAVAGNDKAGAGATPPDDAALYDPANKYTVKVIEYVRNERNLQWAWGTYDHLVEQGLPVFSVQGSDDSLFLFVGAAPARDDLFALRDKIRETTGPDGRRLDFERALIVPIKSYIKRP
jgi:hypothetical protein